MKRSTQFKRIACIFMTLLLAFSVFGTITSAAGPFTVDSPPSTLEVGQTHQVKAYVGNNEITDEVEWSSDDDNVATVSEGLITGVSKGTAKISAAYGGANILFDVTVRDPAPALVKLESTMPSPVLLPQSSLGKTIGIIATFADSSSRDVAVEGTWISSNENIVTVQYGALIPVNAGTATVTFSYQNQTIDFAVTITPPLPIFEGLWTNNAAPTISVGGTHQIAMKGIQSDETKEDIDSAHMIYGPEDPEIATVSDSGVITGVSTGTTTIRAFYIQEPNPPLMLDITVTVQPAPTVVSLTTNANLNRVVVREGRTVNPPIVTAHYSDSTEKVVTDLVTWATAHPERATVSDTGLITGVKAISTKLIIAFEGVTAQVDIFVMDSSYYDRIAIEPASLALHIGGTRQLAIKGVQDDTSATSPITSRLVSYSSSIPTVATVSSNGVVTAISAGTATITANYLVLSSSITVTVTPAPDSGSNPGSGTSGPSTPSVPSTPPAESSTTKPTVPVEQPKPTQQTAPLFPTTPTPLQPVFNAGIVDVSLVEKVMAGASTRQPAAFADSLPSWGAEPIDRAARMGIVSGYQDNTFRADQSVTRAEFAKMVSIAFGLKSKEASGFADTQNHWAAQAIEALQGAGVIMGYSDGTFHPNQPISRAEMIAILSRLTQFIAPSSDKFADTQGHWASNAINAFGNAGIISGKGSGQFDPNGDTTRAESIKILIGLLDVLMGKASNTP